MGSKKTSNVFDKGLYDSCINEVCVNNTQHKSGYCEKCRTKKCLTCGKEVSLSNPFLEKRPQCSACRQNKKSIR